jgi:hypothetical protein
VSWFLFIAKTEYSERKARRQPCRITERYVVEECRKTQFGYSLLAMLGLLAALGFPKTDPAQLAVNIVLYTLTMNTSPRNQLT